MDEYLSEFNTEQFTFRKIQKSDLDENYFNLLGQMTQSPVPDIKKLNEEFEKYYMNNDLMQVFVIHDKNTNKIIGNGRIYIEPKLTRGISKVAHIEDIVVDKSYSGQGLGKTMMNVLMMASEKLGCYKAILDCTEKISGFYGKCGFTESGVQMSKYFTQK